MLRKILYTAMVCLFGVASAFAQTGTLSGTITDAASGETLPGSNILIVELSRGSATDVDGNYTIEKIPVGTYTIRASFLGYSVNEQEVNIGSGENTLNIQLQPDTFGLDEIVVTGVISGTPKKKLAFTVGSVTSEELERVPSSDASGALQGKMAGVKVVDAGGTPGQAAAIRLRGSTAIGGGNGGDQDPLIIVDGVILEGTLADIPTQNIKNIEVLKGASAASLYGSRAANGVIQIFTKRGDDLAVGKTSVVIRNEVGTSFLGNKLPLAEHHSFATTDEELIEAGADPANYSMDPTGSFQVDGSGNRVGTVDNIADNPYGTVFDQLDRVYEPGTTVNNFVSISQNTGNSNLSLSFSNLNESGVVKLTDGYNRQNVRFNLDQNITDGLDVSASGSYSQSGSDDVTQGPGSPFWGAIFVQPNYDILADNEEDGSPFNVNADPYTTEDNPLYNLSQESRSTDRDRYLGNLQIRYRPIQSVLVEGSYSLDRTNQIFERFIPKGILSNTGFSTSEDDGQLRRSTFENISQNMSITAGYDERFGDVNVRFKASYLYEDTDFREFGTTANDFALAGVVSWDAITSEGTKSLDNSVEQVRSENIFGIVSFDYRDRYIVDFLVRRDGSSLFGADERYNNYFRTSGAYRVTEDFEIPGVNEFKLRASYGTAGLRPPFSAQYLTYDLNGGNPSKNTLGNPELKPALSKELELGTNIEFMNRFSFEGSYSTTTVEDQILRVPLAAFAGGFEARWENAGTIETNTIEATLNAQAIQKRDMSLSFGINFDRTRQEITQLDVAPFFQGPTTQNADVFFIAEGETFGVMYGTDWVTSLDQLSADQQANLGSDVSVNSDGFVVTGEGTAAEAPVQRVDADGNSIIKIGDVNPDFNMGFSTNFNYKGLGVYMLLDAKIGGDIYNQTKQWLFREARHGDVDQFGKANKKPENYYRAFYNTNNPSSFFVEDGTYLKLREVSVSYRFGKDQLGNLGNVFESINISAIGRNLLTFTDYSGYDPEVAGVNGDITNFAFDGFSYPNFTSLSGSIELRF